MWFHIKRLTVFGICCLLLTACFSRPKKIDLTKINNDNNPAEPQQDGEKPPENQLHLSSQCAPSIMAQTVIDTKDKGQGETTNSKAISTSIYVDGTLSMQGYVAPTDSRYADTLQLLKDVAPSSKTKYYQFGQKSQEINGDRYLDARNEGFYTANIGQSNFDVAQIQSPISSPQNDGLSIIVTDLYQKSADSGEIAEQLDENYLKKGMAVGVLAIRSEFKGKIYDVGRKNEDFYYTTEGKKTNQYRPFYLLLLGSYDNIADFYKRIKSRSTGKEILADSEFVIFYPKLVNKLSHFPVNGFRTTEQLTGKIRRISTINNGKVTVKTENFPIDKLDFSKANDETSTVESTLDYEALPYTLKPKFTNEIKSTKIIEVDVFDSNKEQSQSLKSYVNIENFKIENNRIIFNIVFQSKMLPLGVYGYIVDVFPSELEVPQWWQEWNATDSNLTNGEKTHNLSNFLNSLKDDTQTKAATFPISRLCYVIQKK